MNSVYWFTHFLALMSGVTIGAVIMSIVQINRAEKVDAAYWRGYDDRGRGGPDFDVDHLA